MRERDANIDQDFTEDESLLLTLNKLFLMKRDGHEPKDYFHHKIRINAYKTRGMWFELHKVPDEHISAEYFSVSDYSLKVTPEDFERMGFPDFTMTGEDGDTLIYDPMGDSFMTAPIHYDYHYVCSHKMESKPGKFIFRADHDIAILVWFISMHPGYKNLDFQSENNFVAIWLEHLYLFRCRNNVNFCGNNVNCRGNNVNCRANNVNCRATAVTMQIVVTLSGGSCDNINF